jgi:Icc protein
MPTTIAQVSDLHCGSLQFVPELAELVVAEVNALEPDILVVTGDLTDMGYQREYEHAAEILQRMECPRRIVIPGNHDARNVGEVFFEQHWGSRNDELVTEKVHIIGLDSSEPDLDSGRIGRQRYQWMADQFLDDMERFKIVALHHHLVPVPGTGRERNIVLDAGDMLRVLSRVGADVVLCGHKHVPNVWRIDDLIVVNTGTACTLKLRGRVKPAYSIVEIDDDHRIRVTHKTPGDHGELVADYRKVSRTSCVWRPSFEYDEGEHEW